MIKCISCDVDMNFTNIYTERGFGCKRLRVCRNCGPKVLEQEKEKYYLKTYKNNKIYSDGSKFVPYLDCHYYFKTLEDCRARIDNKCAIIQL